jgi:carboxyl-terminal processing protease
MTPHAGWKGENMSHPMNRRGRAAVIAAIVAVTMLVSIVFTVLALSALGFRRAGDTASLVFENTPDNATALKKLKFYLDTVKDGYLEVQTDAQMIERLTEGLPAAMGNPYTYYLSPAAYTQHVAAMSGEYSGIGVIVNFTDKGEVVVSEVLKGSPAEGVGIIAGDRITHVDGAKTETFANREALTSAVRGPKGSQVEIRTYRPSDKSDHIFAVIRASITNASLNYRMLENGIGYIHVKEFSTGVAKEFIGAVNDLTKQGAKSFVLDLRFNLGGSADEVLEMLDFLLPAGRIAEVRGRKDGKDISYTWDSGPETGVSADTRYAILVNNFSASASELFSGCLREYEKAVLIGEQTFGKGTGTTTISYEDGSAVNLAFFKYYFPVSGICIEGEGLKPDTLLVLPEEYRYLAVSLIPAAQDNQLAEGLRYLRSLSQK